MNAIIALEALDGVGKSTVAKFVARKLNAVVYRPSSAIDWATKQATSLPYGSSERSGAIREIITSMSKEIKFLAISNTVIVDRFYASWASDEVGNGNFRITDLSIYDWPRDLIKPKLSVHLRVDEDERIRRIGTRDYQNPREIKLGNDHSYRHRVLRGLTRLTDCDVDNTFRSPEETATLISEMYHEKNRVANYTLLAVA